MATTGRLRGKGRDSTTAHLFVAYNASNQIWNGSAFEDAQDSHLATYGIAATQLGTSGWYVADAPTNAVYYVLCPSPLVNPLVVTWEYTLILPDTPLQPTGPNPITLQFEDQNADPVANVSFRIVGQGDSRAGSDGIATFGLPTGTYTVVAAITNGTVFTDTTITVPDASTIVIEGTAPIIPDPPTAEQTTGYYYTDAPLTDGDYWMTDVPAGSGIEFNGTRQTVTSDSSALWAVSMYKGAKYRILFGSGKPKHVTIPVDAADRTPLANILRE